MARVYEMTQRLSEALAMYRRAVDLDPQRDDLRQQLVAVLLHMGSGEEALPHVEYLRKRQPDNPQIQVYLARCLDQTGDRPAAEKLLDEVLARQPNFVPALAERGKLALNADQTAQAETWLRRAVELDPGAYSTRQQFYDCLNRNGKPDEARRERSRLKEVEADLQRIEKLSAAMHMARNDPDLHCEVGEIALRSGAFEEARRWFQTALKQDPNHARAHAGLERLYSRMGNSGMAARHRALAHPSSSSGNGQKSEVKDQKSEVRGQKSEAKDQKPEKDSRKPSPPGP
jgi:predicted Zn-dependent protease